MMERARFPRAGVVTPLPGGSGHRPAGTRPVREVLAALAPGRVLPFAPGNSRKRGPELSRGSKLGECRGGAPTGERPRRAAAAPAHNQVATSDYVARLQDIAPSGAPPPFVYVEANS